MNGIDRLPPLREVISRHGLRARRSLGQNFLLDVNLTDKIVRKAGPVAGHDILEIGPGPGGLTRSLIAAGPRRVVAVEKDRRFLPALEELAEVSSGILQVVHADALDIDPATLIAPPARIVANLPYNAGTALLESIAQAGQGRYYFTSTPDNIPQIMTQEARLAARSQEQERTFTPRLVASAPAVKGMDPLEWPELTGYMRVNAKPSAEILLQSDLGDTILAQWQLGLGRSVAWTADAGEEWATAWQNDAAFARLWPQAVRWAMAPPTPSDLHVAIETDGDLATVHVESREADGSFRNLAVTHLDVVGPDGEGRQMSVPQVAPGSYAVTFTAAERGPYAVQVTQAQADGTVIAQTTTGFAVPYAREYAAARANRVLLERLAAETGGLRLDSPAASFSRDTVREWQAQPLWPYLFAAALVLFIADVAVRRFRLTPTDLPAALGALARRVWARRPSGWRAALRGLSPLRASRSRPRP